MVFSYKSGGKQIEANISYNQEKDGLPASWFWVPKLIAFAGCLTASHGDVNITKMATSVGTKTAVGWTESLAQGSHSNWLDRYNNYMGSGHTVQEAIDKANSFHYLDNSVKSYKLYGDPNTRIALDRSSLPTQVSTD